MAVEAQLWVTEASKLRRLYDDPILFARECLGFEPWEVPEDCVGDSQADVMRAVAAHDYVAVRSGHKVGKSRLAAALAIWWGVTRSRAHVIMTAPTFDQVKDPLWSELRDLVEHARVKLTVLGEPGLDPSTGWRLGGKRIVRGRTAPANKPEAIAGKSGDQLFFIVDEASGYSEVLFRALFGNLAGGGKMLLLSNPTQTSGTFYQAFHDRQHLWKTLHVRSIDTPNFHGGHVPGIATPEWLARQAEDWGEGSEAYLVRALGEFPSASSDAVISLQLWAAAKQRYLEALTIEDAGGKVVKKYEAFDKAKELLHFGVDVGRGGDDSVILPRRGYMLGPIAAFNGAASEDGAAVAGRVMIGVRALRRDGELPFVKVDLIGYGASAYDHLKPYATGKNTICPGPPEILLYGVNSGQRSDDELRFHNLRSQLHFGCRDWLRSGGQVPEDTKLGGEAVAAKWKTDERGRVQVERKDDIKKRLHRSPDRFDALCMAVYDRATGYVGELPAVTTHVSPMA